MDKKTITNEQELRLGRQASEVVSRARRGVIPFDLVSSRLQAIIKGNTAALPAEKRGKKRDLAEEERWFWQGWFQKLGFADIQVPTPAVSNRDFACFMESGSGLIWVPANSREFYERFMTAVGQGNHWTVAHADREGIVWDEPAANGYWLRVEMSQDCPRLGTPWNALSRQIRLLTLPEYAIAWHAVKARTGQMLDARTWSWLRTRYKFSNGQVGALRAYVYEGALDVCSHRPESLGRAYNLGGGRAVEAVKTAS
jgi:hypothetical protein